MSDGRDDRVDKPQDRVDEESVSKSASETDIEDEASAGPTPAITRRSGTETRGKRGEPQEPEPAITRRKGADTRTGGHSQHPAPDHQNRPLTQGHSDQYPASAGQAGRLGPEEILEYTTDRRSLASHVKLQWGLWTTVSVVILTAILTGILANFGVDPRFGTLVLVVLFLLGMGWVGLRYRRWVYQVREDSLYLERGVVTHVRTLVPYVRIQHVDTSRSPLERTLGLSTLVVYTAGSRGADVSIPGLTPEEARDLQQRVKELAIEAEGDDAV